MLNRLFLRSDSSLPLDKTFIFPYSTDKLEKRAQIWANLQKGLLLEDKQILIPWLTPFNQLDQYREQRRDRGDRTLWYFGEHTIIDGYSGRLETMKWGHHRWNLPMAQIRENLGFDHEGYGKFQTLRKKFTDLLGDPTRVDLEDTHSTEIGSIVWENDLAHITLMGINHFVYRYSLQIGLINTGEKQ